MLEGYTALGFLAAHTTHAKLQLLVTGVTYRHPGLLAKIVSTLDVLSAGRATLGIGAAWYEREHERVRRTVPADRRAVRTARGDAADRETDVERRQRAVQRSPLRPRRNDQLAAAAAAPPSAHHDRRRRGEEDAAAGRQVRRRLQSFAGTTAAVPTAIAAKLDVLREHCAREGARLRRIRKSIM